MSFRPSLVLLLLGVSTATLLPGLRAEAKYTAELDADTLVLTGDGKGDTLAVRLTPGDPTHLDVDVSNDGTADFSFDRSLFSAISILAGAGRDTILIDETAGAFTDEKIVIDGGGGNDTITGGSGDDTIIGGNGNDVIDPRRGSDVVQAGAGDDTVIWNPGDGSDAIEGEDGDDRLVFNGANINEIFDFSANGSRARMTRNVANITMDLNGVEEVDLTTLGGADTVTVNDLTGTDLGHVNVDLNGAGGVADTLVDTVVVTGTAGPDVVTVGATHGVLEVEGVGSQVSVTSAEPELDVLDFVVQGADEVHVLGTSDPDHMVVTPSPASASVRTSVDGFPTCGRRHQRRQARPLRPRRCGHPQRDQRPEHAGNVPRDRRRCRRRRPHGRRRRRRDFRRRRRRPGERRKGRRRAQPRRRHGHRALEPGRRQ